MAGPPSQPWELQSPVLAERSSITEHLTNLPVEVRSLPVPQAVADTGDLAAFRFLEFFAVRIENPHTRRAYYRNVYQFCVWLARRNIPIHKVTSLHIASFLEHLKRHQYSKPTIKQYLAAIRELLDWQTVGGVLPFNPAAAVRGPKHVVGKGSTPVLTEAEATHLLTSIDTSHVVGCRDKALVAMMTYTFCRIDAALEMDIGRSYFPQGKRWMVKLEEKNGKVGVMPTHHLLEEALDAYIEAAGGEYAFLAEDNSGESTECQSIERRPLFRTARGRSRQLTNRRMSQSDAWRMIRRRARDAGIETRIGNHTFRATGITNFIENGGTLENAQKIAMHSSIRTTKLYDRTDDQITLDEVERISIGRSTVASRCGHPSLDYRSAISRR